MTKREQIEEMEKIVDEMYNVYTTTEEDIAYGLYNVYTTTAEDIAYRLYNACYRKIDDDCAVITKDELKQYKVQAVKEFVEKLKSRKFDKDMFNDWAGATYVVLVRDIDELLKEYEE